MRASASDLAALILLGLYAAPADAQPLAFPGAEGAGRHSAGGRGGVVLRVTTLADSGPGSLRAAVETRGPRTILFDVAGTIRLASDLVVREPRITIAGQTAPGGGIAIADQALVVNADDVVIRHIRVRRGDRSPGDDDSIWIAGGRRIILDHVSASWSIDETLSASARYEEGGFYDLTVQWSIIAESLRRSHHAEGEHGYGSLIRGGRGARISFHHNLWAHHVARMPRPGNYAAPEADPEGPMMEFRSNVFYNWGRGFAGYNDDEATLIRYSFIDNAYLAGPDSEGALAFRENNRLARAWFAGNSMNGAVPDDPWSLVGGRIPEGLPTCRTGRGRAGRGRTGRSRAARVCWRAPAPGRATPPMRVSSKACEPVPAAISTARTRSAAGPSSQPGPLEPDGDGDGMPDAWERRRGFDPGVADGHRDRDGDGLTNLEDYLAERAG